LLAIYVLMYIYNKAKIKCRLYSRTVNNKVNLLMNVN